MDCKIQNLIWKAAENQFSFRDFGKLENSWSLISTFSIALCMVCLRLQSWIDASLFLPFSFCRLAIMGWQCLPMLTPLSQPLLALQALSKWVSDPKLTWFQWMWNLVVVLAKQCMGECLIMFLKKNGWIYYICLSFWNFNVIFVAICAL